MNNQRNPFNIDWGAFMEPVTIGTNLELLRRATTTEVYNQPEPSTGEQSAENEAGNDEAGNDTEGTTEGTTGETTGGTPGRTTERLCSICQQNYQNGQIIRKINHCEHFYHQPCLDEWLENHTKCPECQYDLRTNLENENGSGNTIGPRNEGSGDENFQNFLRDLLTIPIQQPERARAPQPRNNNPLNNVVQGFLNQIQQDPGEGVINIEYHRQGQPPMVMNAASSRPQQAQVQMQNPAQAQQVQRRQQPQRDQPIQRRQQRPRPLMQTPQRTLVPAQQQNLRSTNPQLRRIDRVDRLERELAQLRHHLNLQSQPVGDPILSQHHLVSDLPQSDFREVDLGGGIFDLRRERERPRRSGKTSNKKNSKDKKKSKWKFWK